MITFLVFAVLAIFIGFNIDKIKDLNQQITRLHSWREDVESGSFNYETLRYSMEPEVEELYKISPDEVLFPEVGSVYSSGFDVKAAEAVVLAPGGRYAVRTGLRFDIPSGYEIQVRPRSGLALKHGVTVLNTPGTIDEDYTGEVKVILYNSDSNNSYEVNKGDKIAQLVLMMRNPATIFERVTEVSKQTERGENGFGSTGR